jgi:SagB-type dehydrogenase family enzyme
MNDSDTKALRQKLVKEYRKFLKHPASYLPQELIDIDNQTDEALKVPPPPLQKEYPEDAPTIDLVSPQDFKIGTVPILDAINNRRSIRNFSSENLSLEELSFLLWVSQGVRKVSGQNIRTFRTVPAGGSRHPFVTNLIIFQVDGITPGLYRYLPLDHKLVDLGKKVSREEAIEVGLGQKFVGNCAAVFIWSVIPYRAEWRYDVYSYKSVVLDCGHVCQNLYLGCTAIDAGTCAIASYDQDKTDKILDLDGTDEFTIYLAPVGKKG